VNDVADRTVLRVDRLAFSYPTRHVFSGWSAAFDVGLTWIRGPNGSGKSTLLQLLAGALMPEGGRLVVRGIAADERPIEYRREVIWCGSGAIAFDHLRAPEFFGFMRGLYPRFDTQALDGHIAGFGLLPHLDQPLRALSAGSQRKVWLAAALSAGTAAVLIDEPINALDAPSLAHLHDALVACAADPARAWIVTSHEPLGPAGERAAVIELAV
jgi:ABC-type multidrug transport system ATPase subunit